MICQPRSKRPRPVGISSVMRACKHLAYKAFSVGKVGR